MNKLAHRNAATLATAGQSALYRMRTASPHGERAGRRPSLKKLLGQGSQVIDRLIASDPQYGQAALECWKRMEVAWNSASRADRRTALTCLQLLLAKWTAEDANVAADSGIQNYRKTLHLALDH